MMRKQLNNYDGVLTQLENEDLKNSVRKGKVSEKDKAGDKRKARWYDLGLLLTKLIKNIFCCLSECQQIGKAIIIITFKAQVFINKTRFFYFYNQKLFFLAVRNSAL